MTTCGSTATMELELKINLAKKRFERASIEYIEASLELNDLFVQKMERDKDEKFSSSNSCDPVIDIVQNV